MPNDYTDSGSLFRNDKKELGTKQPDYRGELNFTCTHCGTASKRSLAAWIREAKNGRKFFSLSFKPAQPQNGKAAFNRRIQQEGQDLDAVFGPPADDEF